MKDHKSVFLAWKSPEAKDWHVVGLLSGYEGAYTFNYTKGVLASEKFTPFSGMEDFHNTYKSKTLFPLFQNRLLSQRRPEYPAFLKWLGLSGKENASAIDVLGRSGGIRVTDQLQMFTRVDFDDNGRFEHIFFAHSLGHLAEEAKNRVSQLQKGEKLYLCSDSQNAFDDNAVIIRTENPAEIVGYCPRFLASDITSLLKSSKKSINIYVESLSDDAPDNYRLMCRIEGEANEKQVEDFMNKEEFQILDLNSEERLAG